MRTVHPSEWKKKVRKSVVNPYFGQSMFESRDTKSLLRKSFCSAWREFCRNTHIRGMRVDIDNQASAAERHTWTWSRLIIFLAAVSVMGFVVKRHAEWPSVMVSFPSLDHSIAKIPFPAVALCGYEIVGHQAAMEYARYLYNESRIKGRKRYAKYNVDLIYKNLLFFNDLVTYSLRPVDLRFMEFLIETDPVRRGNVTQIMLELSTPCSQQLTFCSWRGVVQPCDELMAPRLTAFGFCCVFNGRYQLSILFSPQAIKAPSTSLIRPFDRYTSPEDVGRPAMVLDKLGPDFGLFLSVKRRLYDHTHRRQMAAGTEVMLFDGTDYPLQEGGSAKTYPAVLHASTFLVLSAAEQTASEAVRNIAPNRRGCWFGTPGVQDSYAWCLVNCRRDSLRQLCGCVPFQLLPDASDTVCSLDNLMCLNKYKEKVTRYEPPPEDADDSLREELVDSINCQQCLPDCARIRYKANVYIGKYHEGRRLFRNSYSRHMNVLNSSVIRVFYSTEAQRLYQLEVTQLWFVLTSLVGGPFNLLFGATLLVMTEIIYYHTCRWRLHYTALVDHKPPPGPKLYK